jgi:hypothetical protein
MTKSTWISLACSTLVLIGIAVYISSYPRERDSAPLPPQPKSEDIRVVTLTPEDQKFVDDMKKSEEATEKKKEATRAGIEYFNQAIKAQDI